MVSNYRAAKSFRHWARQERTRAERARADARATDDLVEKTNLEAIADGHEEQARIYDKEAERIEKGE